MVYFGASQLQLQGTVYRGRSRRGRDSLFRRLLSGFRNFVHIAAVGWTFEGGFLRIDMDTLEGSSVVARGHMNDRARERERVPVNPRVGGRVECWNIDCYFTSYTASCL